jgi:hypothetical protein
MVLTACRAATLYRKRGSLVDQCGGGTMGQAAKMVSACPPYLRFAELPDARIGCGRWFNPLTSAPCVCITSQLMMVIGFGWLGPIESSTGHRTTVCRLMCTGIFKSRQWHQRGRVDIQSAGGSVRPDCQWDDESFDQDELDHKGTYVACSTTGAEEEHEGGLRVVSATRSRPTATPCPLRLAGRGLRRDHRPGSRRGDAQDRGRRAGGGRMRRCAGRRAARGARGGRRAGGGGSDRRRRQMDQALRHGRCPCPFQAVDLAVKNLRFLVAVYSPRTA